MPTLVQSGPAPLTSQPFPGSTYVPQPQPQPEKSFPLRDEYEHITQKMYTQNLALAQTNRTLSILRAIDLLIQESSRDLAQLSTDISKAIIDASPYAVVGILSLSRYDEHFISLQGLSYSSQLDPAVTIASRELLKSLTLTLDSNWLHGPRHNLIVNMDTIGKLGLGEEITKAFTRLHIDCNVNSFYFTKLSARSNLNGMMVIGLEETMPKIDDIELIERLSEPAGIALDNRLLYEQNQRFVKQLQGTNDHLKELDQAKDEFISLVSHQLRTPLTSIKGLLSIVLDGDVGQVSQEQRTMLQQAFDSSQRMVYLIADLLNASRLQSGKFVIMDRITYLPDVIASELNQLAQAAATRNIKLNFVKPDNFPKVMLDETKIRQVIMNFLDNALYYTPSGGHIDVALKATTKTIEYTVTDSGLGVPQAERDKLFTKFFRAANARKMRPEGTGLGLYMAKKVVVAQGGAILFDSIENRGSVFGFVFPLDKVAVTPEAEQGAAAPVA